MVNSETQKKKLEIHEYGTTKLEKPTVIVGFPEVGLVGTIATSYLIKSLTLPEIGHIQSPLEPALVIIQKGRAKFPIRLFGKENLAVFLSEVPLTPSLSYELIGEIVKWSIQNESQLLVGITGIPSEDRVNMEGAPKVFSVSTTNLEGDQKSLLSKLGVGSFEEGVISGGYALLLKRSLSMNQPNLTLLAESHLQFPDPGAAAAIIEVLNPMLSLKLDVKPLLDESEQVRLKMRELMSRTQQSMHQTSEQDIPRVYA